MFPNQWSVSLFWVVRKVKRLNSNLLVSKNKVQTIKMVRDQLKVL